MALAGETKKVIASAHHFLWAVLEKNVYQTVCFFMLTYDVKHFLSPERVVTSVLVLSPTDSLANVFMIKMVAWIKILICS